MTLREALGIARETLAASQIEDATLECELLLRHVLQIGRAQLYLILDRKLDAEQEKAFRALVRRRLNREPAAYITGHREFYGLDFKVSPSVLITRPESELLVEKAIKLAQNRTISTIADIGTGCGAIAISLALSLPQAKIYATDVSADALEVALANCQKYDVTSRVCLLLGDMLDPLPEPVDIIVANLPYVRECDLATIDFEPPLALDGGADGLEKIRRLCGQLPDRLRPDGSVLLEIGQGQEGAVITLLGSHFPSAEVDVARDLNGIKRVVSLSLI